jgi:hypothetical protein
LFFLCLEEFILYVTQKDLNLHIVALEKRTVLLEKEVKLLTLKIVNLSSIGSEVLRQEPVPPAPSVLPLPKYELFDRFITIKNIVGVCGSFLTLLATYRAVSQGFNTFDNSNLMSTITQISEWFNPSSQPAVDPDEIVIDSRTVIVEPSLTDVGVDIPRCSSNKEEKISVSDKDIDIPADSPLNNFFN